MIMVHHLAFIFPGCSAKADPTHGPVSTVMVRRYTTALLMMRPRTHGVMENGDCDCRGCDLNGICVNLLPNRSTLFPFKAGEM